MIIFVSDQAQIIFPTNPFVGLVNTTVQLPCIIDAYPPHTHVAWSRGYVKTERAHIETNRDFMMMMTMMILTTTTTNSLPDQVVTAPSLQAFQARVAKLL
jgi:hypothetical protein